MVKVFLIILSLLAYNSMLELQVSEDQALLDTELYRCIKLLIQLWVVSFDEKKLVLLSESFDGAVFHNNFHTFKWDSLLRHNLLLLCDELYTVE